MIRFALQFRRVLSIVLFALWAGVAPGAFAQTPVAPIKFNDQPGPCAEARVAARGRELLALGWTVASGPQRGVWLRWRVNFAIEPVARRVGGELDSPRDLAMVFDSAGGLHMVWTALADGERRLYHSRIDRPGEAPAAAQVLAKGGSDPATMASLDFPSLAAGDDGSVLLVWQESRGLSFNIRSMRIAGDGTVSDLGIVSGANQSSLNPQILATFPPRIVWEEVTELDSRLRVSEWDAAVLRWRPSIVELEARRFESRGSVILREGGAGQGLIGCWQQTRPDGRSALIIGKPDSASAVEIPNAKVFDQPPGDHVGPNLAGARSGQPTLAWQAFADGRQAVCIAAAANAASPVILSPAAQRFAAQPDHVTIGRWSAVAWVDDARDGGTGDIYFSEVTWPAE